MGGRGEERWNRQAGHELTWWTKEVIGLGWWSRDKDGVCACLFCVYLSERGRGFKKDDACVCSCLSGKGFFKKWEKKKLPRGCVRTAWLQPGNVPYNLLSFGWSRSYEAMGTLCPSFFSLFLWSSSHKVRYTSLPQDFESQHSQSQPYEVRFTSFPYFIFIYLFIYNLLFWPLFANLIDSITLDHAHLHFFIPIPLAKMSTP